PAAISTRCATGGRGNWPRQGADPRAACTSYRRALPPGRRIAVRIRESSARHPMCIGKIFMETHDVKMTGEVAVGVPRWQMFRLWRNVENLPALVGHLASVERREGRRSRWTVSGTEPPLVWEVEAEDEVENERLGWRSVPGASVDSAASVSFAPLDAGA